MRNRRHLRRIPGKQVEQEEEGEEEDDDIQEDLRAPISPAKSTSSTSPASPARPTSQARPTSPAKPAVSADPEPAPVQHNPVQPEPVQLDPITSEPRRSGWSSVPPSRLEVTGNGKSYAAVVSTGFTGQRASVGGKGCGPSVPKRSEGVRLRGGRTVARP